MQGYQRTITPFTVPGHKLARHLDLGEKSPGQDAFRYDVLELAGFDDIHKSFGAREKAEKLAAELYSADQCFFSTGGSTLSAQVVLTTVAWPGDKVLVARNCHKSTVCAMVLNGAVPIYIQPEFDDELDVSHGVTPESVQSAIGQHPDAKAVYVVSPSYYGVAIDVKGIAEVCHAANLPLIVDEAWGSHFDLHPDLPRSAMVEGADVAFMSLHKSELALCQGSVMCVKGKRIDPTRWRSFMKPFGRPARAD